MPNPLAQAASPQDVTERVKEFVRARYGVEPERRLGTNAEYWEFRDGDRTVRFGVVAPGFNTATFPAGGFAWMLRVEEPPPAIVAKAIAAFFRPRAGLTRNMGTTVRTQFKSADLV